MNQYPAYKNSGIEWLGEVPDHWNIHRLSTVVDIRQSNVDKKTKDDEDKVRLCNYVDVYKNDFITEAIDFMIASAPPSQIQRFKLYKGDVIITKDSESPDDIGIAALVAEDIENLICGYHLAILRPIDGEICGPFLKFIIGSTVSSSQFSISARGVTRFGLSHEAIKNIKISLPPLPEQKSIVRFLDDKTAQIDALIEKKEKLLALLAEKRTALITQAVTKGLNPDALMKDSGIEWLGKVPRRWEVKKLKYIARLKSGTNIISQMIEKEGEYPVYGGNGLRGYYSEFTHNGDYVLVGRQGALCGNINYAHSKFWASEHAVVVDIIDGSSLLWLGELLRSMNLNQYSVSAAQPGLSVETVQNLYLPSPPVHEQNSIAQFLAKEVKSTNELEDQIKEAIIKLKEYRTSLITHAVTGKIDVRNYQPETLQYEQA